MRAAAASALAARPDAVLHPQGLDLSGRRAAGHEAL
jgi:hypothetical protein